ncbi:MAG TPA: ATP-binding protein [Actinomycetota bacterium]|nr:ATP-binding protein [Actinomycetota bacterium]
MEGVARQPQPDARRPDELGALYRVATLGASGDGEPSVVDDVLLAVADVVPCERPLLFLFDDGADEIRVHSLDGELHPLSTSEPSIVRRIHHSGIGEVVNEVVADPDSSPVQADALDARQLVGAPLQVGRDRLGVVAALNSRRGAFAAADLRLLEALANRAALALENERLRATLHRQSQELTGLHRLSRLLTASETVDHAIGESVRIVCDLLGCERMAVLLYDDDAAALVAQPPVVGMDDDQVAELRVPLAEPSLVGTVYRTDTALVSNDAPSDAWVGERLQRLLGAANLLVAPLTAGPRPIGVLLATDARKGRFDDNDVRFTTLLGSRIGGVIEASQARERERALVQRLREADRTKTEFVSMLAHELKGPMTAVKGFGEALRDDWSSLDDARRGHIVDVLVREIERVSRLVNDLLDVSRMEAGTVRYELEPTSLPELVDGILDVHPSLTATHLVEGDVPPDLPKVLADRDRLRQILLNLLTNATRYSPDGTRVMVSARVADDDRHVEVTVSDEGIGIAPEDRERVFSKFVMLPKPGWVKKGTGLGLYITKGIVEAHGGRIWAESEPGRGSSFRFTLKIASDDARG